MTKQDTRTAARAHCTSRTPPSRRARRLALLLAHLLPLCLMASNAQADVWTTEFEAEVYAVHPDLASTFQVGQRLTGSYSFSGTVQLAPASGSVAYQLTEFHVQFPGYNLESTPAQLDASDAVSFTNDIDYGNPLADVADMYIATVDSFVAEPPVGGHPLTYFVIRIEQRGTPPITVFSDGDPMYAPPNLSAITYLKYGVLQFDGFRNVEFRVNAIRLVSVTSDDTDSDGVVDVDDNCPAVPNPDQTDSDLDGAGDACDPDDDDDGFADGADNCPLVANPSQADRDGDGLGNPCDGDLDGDGFANAVDNCPAAANSDQTDTDQDGQGDECDTDDDGDGLHDADDNCPAVQNPDQDDLDGDGIGDACDSDLDGDGASNEADNCPIDANVGQDDSDGDGMGDTCDPDADNDTVANASDNCPLVANPNQTDADNDGAGNACDSDLDGDGVGNGADNCPITANSGQTDLDGDGQGDACDADADGDGVGNESDECAATPNGSVTDPLHGCSIAQLCPCEGPRGTVMPWRNHGKYQSCVAHAAGDFESQGLISSATKDALVSAAGRSSCGQ